MADVDRASCRRAAAECIALARITTDIEAKQVLLTRGQEWLKLAYSDHEDEFDRLLGEFNAQQMGVEQSAAHRGPMRRQAMQQQQAKAEREGE
jgi:ubiquinone biosynthesis protein UbiJ